jgi:hypothetical protein
MSIQVQAVALPPCEEITLNLEVTWSKPAERWLKKHLDEYVNVLETIPEESNLSEDDTIHVIKGWHENLVKEWVKEHKLALDVRYAVIV